jgi:hypothetical protein
MKSYTLRPNIFTLNVNVTRSGISPLIQLADCGKEAVQVEAVAALANLAVNDDNEIEIGKKGTLTYDIQYSIIFNGCI